VVPRGDDRNDAREITIPLAFLVGAHESAIWMDSEKPDYPSTSGSESKLAPGDSLKVDWRPRGAVAESGDSKDSR